MSGRDGKPAVAAMGTALARFIAARDLPRDFAADVRCCYAPLAEWLVQRCRTGALRVVGLSGAQGTGKSTLAELLQELIECDSELRVAVLALDDFYLPRAHRERLAREVHPLLATRGVPGTHDTALLRRTLARIADLGAGEFVVLPEFDKACDERLPDGAGMQLNGPVNLVLFEGWCVGVPPQSTAELDEPVNEFERERDAQGVWRRYVNDRLAVDYGAVFERLDDLVFLRAPGFDAVYRWRLEQERKLAATRAGGAIMDGAGIREFIRYYERLTIHGLESLPAMADVTIDLDAHHRCANIEFHERHDG